MKQQFSNYFVVFLFFSVFSSFGMQQYEEKKNEEYAPIIPKDDIQNRQKIDPYLSPQTKRKNSIEIPLEVSKNKKGKSKKQKLMLDGDDIDDMQRLVRTLGLGNIKNQSQFLTWLVLHTFSETFDHIPLFKSHIILITAEKMLYEEERGGKQNFINSSLNNFRKTLVTRGVNAPALEIDEFLKQKSVMTGKKNIVQSILRGRIKKNYSNFFSEEERKQIAKDIKNYGEDFLPLLMQFFWESNYGNASKLRREIDEVIQKNEQYKSVVPVLDKHHTQLWQQTIKDTIFPFACTVGFLLMIKLLSKLKRKFPELFKSIENLLFLTFLRHETWSQQPVFVMRGTKMNGETELLQMPITVRVS